MKPSWIEECWQTWRQGDDIDVEAVGASLAPEAGTHGHPLQSIAAHRLPIFAGVTVCVSGLDDVARRAQINRDVARYGGAYAKALERPVRVTHLLCTGLAETDKMRYAAKFNRAGEARIRLVWDRWFADCVEFGGARPPAVRTPLRCSCAWCRQVRRGRVRRIAPVPAAARKGTRAAPAVALRATLVDLRGAFVSASPRACG
jgi:hypothetical protein